MGSKCGSGYNYPPELQMELFLSDTLYLMHVKRIFRSSVALIANPLFAIHTDSHFLCMHTVHLFTLVTSYIIRIFTVVCATAYPLLDCHILVFTHSRLQLTLNWLIKCLRDPAVCLYRASYSIYYYLQHFWVYSSLLCCRECGLNLPLASLNKILLSGMMPSWDLLSLNIFIKCKITKNNCRGFPAVVVVLTWASRLLYMTIFLLLCNLDTARSYPDLLIIFCCFTVFMIRKEYSKICSRLKVYRT